MVKNNSFRKKAHHDVQPLIIAKVDPLPNNQIPWCNCVHVHYMHTSNNPACKYYFKEDKQPPTLSLTDQRTNSKSAEQSAFVFQHQEDWKTQPIQSRSDNQEVSFPVRKECRCSGKGYVTHYWGDVGCLFLTSGVLKGNQEIREEAKIPWKPAPTVAEDRLVAAYNKAMLSKPDIFSAMMDGSSMTHSAAKLIIDELHIMGYDMTEDQLF